MPASPDNDAFNELLASAEETLRVVKTPEQALMVGQTSALIGIVQELQSIRKLLEEMALRNKQRGESGDH